MVQTLEAQIDENGVVRLLEEPAREECDTALLSETSLAVDWNRSEEAEAWECLQSPK